MRNQVKIEAELDVVSLVGGIVRDFQKLIEQQFALVRREIEGELRQAKFAAIFLAGGAAIMVIGSIFLLLMVIHALHAYTALPLWGAYGLVGGLLVGVGALLLYIGRTRANAVHLVPPPESAQALKENIEWLKKQTTCEQA